MWTYSKKRLWAVILGSLFLFVQTGCIKSKIKVTTTQNSGASAASKDVTAPVEPTNLTWSISSPSSSLTLTASWTVSASSDLANQKIQFYSDGTCTTTTGELIDLGSAVTATRNFVGSDGGDYSYKIQSIDKTDNAAYSACSSPMHITWVPPLVSIVVTPANSSVLIGNTKQFAATGHYADGSTKNLTTSVIWSRTNGTGTASINSTTGLVDAAATTSGTVTINATSASVSGSTTLTVTGYTASTLAGIFWATSGVGAAATTANLWEPLGVKSDTAGNIYIADAQNMVIRKVSTTGIITNFAGTGLPYTTAAQNGDGGLATAARFDRPSDMVIASNGDVYIADTNAGVIRKVTALTGVISTYAGNGANNPGDGSLASDAVIAPKYMAMNSTGDIFFTETTNCVIRKITVSTGIITTIAGQRADCGYTGTGGLATAAKLQPWAIAFDASDHLYVAEKSNNRVRRIDASTGIISVFAGTGVSGSAGDGAAATSAQVSQPTGVAYSSAGGGTIFIASYGGSRIRKVVGGTISRVAGTGTQGYSGDGGAATSATIYWPESITVDPNGDFIFSESASSIQYANHVVRKVTVSDGNISTLAGNKSPSDGGSALVGKLARPNGIARDSSGNIYVVEEHKGVVRKITVATGVISTVAGTYGSFSSNTGDGGLATSAVLDSPSHIAIDSNDNLYLSCDTKIRKVNASTGVISTYAGTGAFGNDGDGGLATAAKIGDVNGLGIDNSGNLYASIGSIAIIRKINVSDGKISTVAGASVLGYAGDGDLATTAWLNYPAGIAFDTSNNMYFADSSNYAIRKVNASDGKISTIAGTGVQATQISADGIPATSAELGGVEGISIDSSGNIYFPDTGGGLRKVNGVTGNISTIASTAISRSVLVDPSGNVFYYDSNYENVLKKLTP